MRLSNWYLSPMIGQEGLPSFWLGFPYFELENVKNIEKIMRFSGFSLVLLVLFLVLSDELEDFRVEIFDLRLNIFLLLEKRNKTTRFLNFLRCSAA